MNDPQQYLRAHAILSSLDPEDASSLLVLITEITEGAADRAAREALAGYHHQCFMDAEQQQNIHRFGYMLGAIGEGDCCRGLERVAENHRRVARWRKTIDGLSLHVGRIVLGAVAVGLIGALWVGFRGQLGR